MRRALTLPLGPPFATPVQCRPPSSCRPSLAAPPPPPARVFAAAPRSIAAATSSSNDDTVSSSKDDVASKSFSSTPLLDDIAPFLLRTVALCTAAVALLLLPCAALLPAPPAVRFAGAVALCGAAARVGFARGALDAGGAVAGCACGVACVASHPAFGAALLAFFVSSSRLTALGAARKAALDADFKGASGRRAADQALATAGVPALLALLHAFAVQNSSVTSSWFRVSSQHAPALAAALLAYLACANGDTWASELGMLDPDDPLLVVLPFKAVPPGTNGAVSWLGTGCSVLGGCLVGAAFALAAAACAAAFPATPAGASAAAATASLPSPRLALALGACAGLVGSFIDSLLGATVQYSGVDDATGKTYNKPRPRGKPQLWGRLRKTGGYDLFSNALVNLLSASATAAAAFCATSYFGLR